MPFGSVRLIPGVNTERTPTLLEAAISQSQLVRFKDSLVQKLGGWKKLFGFAVPGTPRDLHAWQDLNQLTHLSVGTTTELGLITSGLLSNITPQTLTTNFSPNFSTTLNSPTVTITDSNISNVTVNDVIFFNTPVAVGGLILSGLYTITQITGVTSYQITATTNATANVSNAGAVPVFTTTNNSALVSVALTAHGLAVGNTVNFPIATTGNGVTISGTYTVVTVPDANDFTVQVMNTATASSSFSMNSGNAQLVYYICIGPPALGSGYGLGGYGQGPYGIGTSGGGGNQTGSPITATDWTSDNWGQILMACPFGGGIYEFDPTAGDQNACLVPNAPIFNGGIFISNAQQILIAWGSTTVENIGVARDPLLVRWSDSGNFAVWTPLTTNQAGSFRIPTGSKILAGLSTPSQNLIFTDLDCWAMNYQGAPFVFGFNKIGAGAGTVSSHAVQPLRGNVYWMGQSNFFSYTGAGVTVMPCPVWDFVFQNINSNFIQNVRAMPNTPFNEVGWLFPSAASVSGECDSYVKTNVTEPNSPWDYGSLQRSAWIDEGIYPTPIGATPNGIIYQHEISPDADGVALNSSFTTGYFMIAEGEDFAFVDQIIPDMKWGTFPGSGGATVQLTFNITNFPGDTPQTFGPYAVNQATEFISVRFRGRQMAVGVQSADIGSFWRLGRVRYRYAMSGRR